MILLRFKEIREAADMVGLQSFLPSRNFLYIHRITVFYGHWFIYQAGCPHDTKLIRRRVTYLGKKNSRKSLAVSRKVTTFAPNNN